MINSLKDNEVFVFGSNLAGRHGGGAARTALDKFGAVYGVGVGPQGQSYAIPTLDADYRQLSLIEIEGYLQQFAGYAAVMAHKTFYLTPIGTGIAGFSHEEIKAILPSFTRNVIIDESLK